MNILLYNVLKKVKASEANSIKKWMKTPYIGDLMKRSAYHFHLKQKLKKYSRIKEKCLDSFIFVTDVHWEANQKKSPMMIKEIYASGNFDKVFFGGDFINHSYVDREKAVCFGRDFMASLEFAGYKFYSIRGNHDDNSYKQVNMEAILEDKEISDILFPFHRNDIVYGNTAFNYYFDCRDKRIRYLILDTSNTTYDERQITFIKSSLKQTPEGWYVVALAHIWVEWDPVMLNYKTNRRTKCIMNIFDEYNSRNKKSGFDDCGGHVALMIGGHIHKDYFTMSGGGYSDSNI